MHDDYLQAITGHSKFIPFATSLRFFIKFMIPHIKATLYMYIAHNSVKICTAFNGDVF